jgi:magnesium-transporting ATPase (P-type)
VIWLFLALPFVWVFDVFMALLLVGFVTTTMKRLRSRKRHVSDVSIWFWMMGMGLLMIALLSYLTLIVSHYEPLEAMSLIAFALFALSIILGMMGKIVPFLVWFHLNAAGYMETPIMSNIIPVKRLKMSFWLFGVTASTALTSPFVPLLLIASGLSGVALFSLLLFNLVTAAKLYRKVLATGTRFTFEP